MYYDITKENVKLTINLSDPTDLGSGIKYVTIELTGYEKYYEETIFHLLMFHNYSFHFESLTFAILNKFGYIPAVL